MKKTLKKKIPTIDEISEMAADGKDVSEFFTNKFRVRPPLSKDKIKRVNVDFNLEMLKELDALAKKAKRQPPAVIKVFLRQALDQHHLARQTTR
jgi:hypothetical protein